MTWEIREGDCIASMAEMAPESVDAVVCDPPYGIGFMGHDWDQPGVEHRPGPGKFVQPPAPGRGGGRTCQPPSSPRTVRLSLANRQFQEWCQAWSSEALRVLRPGGHLLSFGGTRTSHRLVSGIEDAGFEIRDSILSISGGGEGTATGIANRLAGVDQ
jgi:site-specific DNA-methyltransferase (adenine-specific)